MEEPRKTPLPMRQYLPKIETVGGRMDWAMERAGMTQEELATQLGVDQTSISKLKTGKVKNPRKLDEMAQLLNVPAEWLRYGLNNIDEITPELLELAAQLLALAPDDQDAVRLLIKRLTSSAG